MTHGLLALLFLILCVSQYVIAIQCDQHIDMVPGRNYELRSPNYPNPYPSTVNGYDCFYTAVAPVNHRITMTCNRMDIYGSNNCYWAGFNFYPTGDGQDSHTSYCGRYYHTISQTTNGRRFAAFFYNSRTNVYRQNGFRCLITAVREITFQTTTTPSTTTTTTTTTTSPTTTISSNSQCCGRRNSATRIVGGEEASSNEFPWIVALKTSGGYHFCGGSLISPSWVVTAAHCIKDYYPEFAHQLKVTAGINHLQDYSAPYLQDRNVDRIIMHEGYNEDTVDNDIALVHLTQPMYYTYGVFPVCLPKLINDDDVIGNDGTVIGWGTTSYQGPSSDILLEATIPLYTTNECRYWFDKIAHRLTDNMMCSYDLGKDACQGDSGGPLTVEKNNYNYLVGIVSWGVNCSEVDHPGVYTKVQNYVTWIEDNASEGFCQP